MPVVTIEIVSQSYEKKAEMAKVITDEIHRITGIPKEPIVVLFHEISPENAASAGEMLQEKFKKQHLLILYGINYKYIILAYEIDGNGKPVSSRPEWTNGSITEISDKDGNVLFAPEYVVK